MKGEIMKIYQIYAEITDFYYGDTSSRYFKYYKDRENAEIEKQKLIETWKKSKDCYAVFHVKEIQVIE
jgi:hypothetical protein